MFQDEARYKVDHYVQISELHHEQNKIAKIYSEQRVSLVDRLFQMGKKFTQITKTTHIAVELMDRYFLDKRSQSLERPSQMNARRMTIVLTTCFLIASKYDEIDDHLVFINDV